MIRDEALRLTHTILLSLFAATLLFARPVAAADGQEIYSFVADRLNAWRVGTADTVTEPVQTGLILRSNRSKYSYQIVTASIPVEAGRIYRLSYDMVLRSGNMIIGVQDVAKQTWVVQWPLKSSGGKEERLFQSPADQINIVIANNNSEDAISELAIASLTLSESSAEVDIKGIPVAVAERFPGWRLEPYNDLMPSSSSSSVTLAGAGNSGLYFRRDLDPSKTYRLNLEGAGASALRLRYGDQSPLYHSAPTGSLSYLVDGISGIELLYFSDKAFSYRIQKIDIVECPTCLTDTKLKSLLTRTIPGIERLVKSKPLDAAAVLMNWTAGVVDHGYGVDNVVSNTARMEKMSAGEIYTDIWMNDAGGTFCGGFALFYQRILALFDIPAFTLGVGIVGTDLTHVTTIVPQQTATGIRFYIFDPTFNETYRTTSGRELADMETILKAINADQIRSIEPDAKTISRTAIVPVALIPKFQHDLLIAGAKAECPPVQGGDVVICRNFTYSSAMAFLGSDTEMRKFDITSRTAIVVQLLKRGVNSIGMPPASPQRMSFERLMTQYGIHVH
jgi:hypothetical protein